MEIFGVLFYVTICNLIHSIHSDNQHKTGVCIKETPEPKLDHNDEYFKVREFNLLIRRNVFLDKTLLIKTILDIPQKTIVITSPRRTGKSINLNMLEWFFNHIIEDTAPINHTRTLSYKFFAEGKVYFDDFYSIGIPPEHVPIKSHKTLPLIAQHSEIINEHLAKYPVISVSLAVDDGTDVYNTLRSTIVQLFKTHSFPLATTMEEKIKDNVISKEEKKVIKENLRRFKKMSNSQPANLKTINITDLQTSLLFLSEMMHNHFGRSVIILLDDYCHLLTSELIDLNYHPIREGKLVNFLAKLLEHTLVDNPYLEKAVLTTSLTIARSKLFENHQDVVFYNPMDNDLYQFFTCTKMEAKLLFDYYNIQENLAQEAFEYYDGYNMKPSANETTFNIWSIINFLDKKEVTPFWVDSVGSEFSHNWFVIEKFRDRFQCYLDKRIFTIDYTSDLNFTHKQTIMWINTGYSGPSGEISATAIDIFFSYLCQLGYLTNVNQYDSQAKPQNTDSPKKIPLRFLNQEIRQRMTEDIEQLVGGEQDLF